MLLGLDTKRGANPRFIVLPKNRSLWKALGLPKGLVSVTLFSEPGGSTIFADIEDFSGSSVRTSSVGRATIYSALSTQLFYEVGLQESTPFWYHMAFSQYLSGYTELDTQFRIGELEAMGKRLGRLFNRYGRLKPIDVVSVMSRKSYAVGLGGSEISNTAKRKFLAQAYLIFHYLYSDAGRRDQLDEYVRLTTPGLSVDESLCTAFGVSAQKLSNSIASYAESDERIVSYDRREIEDKLSLPLPIEYRQTKLSNGEFWREVYPQIVNVPESLISFSEKKRFMNTVRLTSLK